MCFATVFSEKKKEEDLKLSFIFINILKENSIILSCIQEEITQAMGLSNDIKQFKKSTLFNDSNETKNLTKLDTLLLKILYDPRVKFGMNRREVKKIFTPIYEKTYQQLQAEGI